MSTLNLFSCKTPSFVILYSVVCSRVFLCGCVCVCYGRAHCNKREHQINNRFCRFFFFQITLHPSLALPSNLIAIMVYSVFSWFISSFVTQFYWLRNRFRFEWNDFNAPIILNINFPSIFASPQPFSFGLKRNYFRILFLQSHQHFLFNVADFHLFSGFHFSVNWPTNGKG